MSKSIYIFRVEYFSSEPQPRVPRIVYGPFDTVGQAVAYAEEKSGFEWNSLTSFCEGTIQRFLPYIWKRPRKAIRH